MSQERARPDANNCFVCGPDNPIGLRLVFRMDGDGSEPKQEARRLRLRKGDFREKHVPYDHLISHCNKRDRMEGALLSDSSHDLGFGRVAECLLR